jgi:hypothetical protein
MSIGGDFRVGLCRLDRGKPEEMPSNGLAIGQSNLDCDSSGVRERGNRRLNRMFRRLIEQLHPIARGPDPQPFCRSKVSAVSACERLAFVIAFGV